MGEMGKEPAVTPNDQVLYTTSKAEGMGIGLSIARTIIEATGGKISAENQREGGASFWIRLPLIR